MPRSIGIVILVLVMARSDARALATDTRDTTSRIDSNSAMHRLMGIERLMAQPKRRIRIAVLDMGFRLSHKKLRNYIHRNTGEVAGNLLDDDKNGYIDDVTGWDVSDEDPDVSVPDGREDRYYHGTYVASIILSVIEKAWGEDASAFVQIIPVKIVSDENPRLQLEDAFKGLAYARSMKPDIICCAWTGGRMDEQESALMRALLASRTLIVAAVGNYMTETVPAPASVPGVLAVASTDNEGRMANLTNYGMRVDLSAPGSQVYGAHPIADNAFLRESGSSPSTAFVTGMAAVLEMLSADAGTYEVREALVNTARPIGMQNPSHAGKLGAGLPDLKAAVEYLLDPEVRPLSHDPERTKGRLLPPHTSPPYRWDIHPSGGFKGLRLQASLAEEEGRLRVFADDTLRYDNSPADAFAGTLIPGRRFQVEYTPRSRRARGISFMYQIESIDSGRLYCGKETLIEATAEGILEDGSGNAAYANNTDCRWRILAPEGKRIRIEGLEVDTESATDQLALYDGQYTMEEALLGRFSGRQRPMAMVSRTNMLLVWFVTGSTGNGGGWGFRYRVVDP